MPKSAALPLLAMCIATLACTRTPAQIETAGDPTRAHEPARTGDTQANARRDGAMILLDAGAQPHELLRHRLIPGPAVRWRAEIAIDIDMTLLDNRVHNRLAFAFDVETEVVSADASAGLFEIHSVFRDLQVSEGEPGELGAYVGLESWTRMNDRGERLEEHYTRAGAPVDPSTVPGLQDALAPTLTFPIEPVGVGARWQKFSEIERSGFMVLQTSEHELTARDGDQVVIVTRTTQEPLTSRIETNDGSGSYGELRAFDVHATGKLDGRLDAAVPKGFDGKVDFGMRTLIVTADAQTEMHMNMQVEHHLYMVP